MKKELSMQQFEKLSPIAKLEYIMRDEWASVPRIQEMLNKLHDDILELEDMADTKENFQSEIREVAEALRDAALQLEELM